MSAPSQPIATRGGIHALRTLLRVASGLESFPTVRRCVAYRFLQSLCQAVPVGLLVVVIDHLRNGTMTASRAWLYGAVGVAALVAQCVFGRMSHSEAWIGGLWFASELRMRVLDHLRRLPMSFHTRSQTGDTAATFTSDMHWIETFTESALPVLGGASALPLAVLIVLFVVDVPLALAVTVSVALSVPVFAWTQARLHRLFMARQNLQGTATARVIEYVQGIAVIRAFNQQGAAQGRLRSSLDDIRAMDNKLVIHLAPLFGAFGSVVRLGVPIVIAAVAYRVFGGSVDVGTGIVFLVLALSVYEPIAAMFLRTGLLHKAAASLDRVARVLDAPAQPEPANPTPLTGQQVEFGHVSFGYQPGITVLDDVSFTAPARSMTAIVGPSGAGKTTMLNLIARFWDPDQGAVRIGGVDLRDVSTDQLFDMVSVVFQEVYLFSGTIYDNIAFGRADAQPDDVVAAAKAACGHDFITALPDGYDTTVGEGGHTLSGGERQRISIARAILKNAPIVLLDEATAALDPINEKLIQQALAALTADKTLLVVAHRLSTVQAADQILAIDNGRIVQRGTHDELIAQGGLYARFCAQREKASGWRLASASRQESLMARVSPGYVKNPGQLEEDLVMRATDKMIQYWNTRETASTYDQPILPGFDPDRYEAAWRAELEGILPPPPGQVLDLGCGTGFVSLALARMGYTVRGVDLADNMLSLARDKARARDLDVAFEHGDAQDPPGQPGSVDAVTSRCLFWTLEDPAALLRSARRLLRPGGTLVVIDGTWFPNGWGIPSSTATRRGTTHGSSPTRTSPRTFLSSRRRVGTSYPWWSRRASRTWWSGACGSWSGCTKRRSATRTPGARYYVVTAQNPSR